MRLPRATMNLKLMIALVACIAVYLNVWRVGTETVVERASRDLRHGKTEARRAAAVSLGDAIIQAGTNLAFAEVAAIAEFWLEKPVIAINTATYWHALRSMGMMDQMNGFGTLLSNY